MIINIEQFLGTYNPLINPDGTYVIGAAGLDWLYIFRALVLLLILATFFTLLVTIVKGVFKRC